MTEFVYELFTKEKGDIIEVFDCYDTRYGDIYYKGNHVAQFYKESYYEVLGKYGFIKDLEKIGIDIEKATVLVYQLEPLRDYQDRFNFTQLYFETAIDNEYDELLENFTVDLAPTQQAIAEAKKDDSSYKFISTSPLKDYL